MLHSTSSNRGVLCLLVQTCLNHDSMDVQLAAMKATCNFIQVGQQERWAGGRANLALIG